MLTYLIGATIVVMLIDLVLVVKIYKMKSQEMARTNLTSPPPPPISRKDANTPTVFHFPSQLMADLNGNDD